MFEKLDIFLPLYALVLGSSVSLIYYTVRKRQFVALVLGIFTTSSFVALLIAGNSLSTYYSDLRAHEIIQNSAFGMRQGQTEQVLFAFESFLSNGLAGRARLEADLVTIVSNASTNSNGAGTAVLKP